MGCAVSRGQAYAAPRPGSCGGDGGSPAAIITLAGEASAVDEAHVVPGTTESSPARLPTAAAAEQPQPASNDRPPASGDHPPAAAPCTPERGPSIDDGAIAALPQPAGRLLSPPNANVLERRAALGSLFAAGLPEPEAEPEPEPQQDPGRHEGASLQQGATEPRAIDHPLAAAAAAQPAPDAVITLLRAQKQQAVGLPSSAPFDAFLRRPRLCRTTVTVAPSPESFGDGGTTSPLLGRLPPELLLEVLARLDGGKALCSAACSCRKLHHAVFEPENDRALWRPISIAMAADGMRPRRGSGCCWRELYVRLVSINSVSLRCRLLEANASRMLEAVLPKLQSAQLSLLETLIQPHLDAFRAIEEPPREVFFACEAMVLLCGADLERAGANVQEWTAPGKGALRTPDPDPDQRASDGGEAAAASAVSSAAACSAAAAAAAAAAAGGGGGGSRMTKEGWLEFRGWFFAEEPCSFLGLRLWELDKNSLSAEAVSHSATLASPS